LTELGIEQAKVLGQRIRNSVDLRDCSALLTSPVRRARQTAEILAGSLTVSEIEEDPDLREIDTGESEGMSWKDFIQANGQPTLFEFPEKAFFPGGESLNQYRRRVGSALVRLADRFKGRTVITVTHAMFIVVSVFERFNILRPGTGTRLEPAHTSLTEWIVSDGVWRLERFNDTSHIIGEVTR